MQLTAMARPSHVLFMASEILADRMVERSAAAALATAPNAPMRPVRVAMLAIDQSAPMRFLRSGVTSTSVSSMAVVIAPSPLDSLLSPALATRASGAFEPDDILI